MELCIVKIFQQEASRHLLIHTKVYKEYSTIFKYLINCFSNLFLPNVFIINQFFKKTIKYNEKIITYYDNTYFFDCLIKHFMLKINSLSH